MMYLGCRKNKDFTRTLCPCVRLCEELSVMDAVWTRELCSRWDRLGAQLWFLTFHISNNTALSSRVTVLLALNEGC